MIFKCRGYNICSYYYLKDKAVGTFKFPDHMRLCYPLPHLSVFLCFFDRQTNMITQNILLKWQR